MRKQDGSLMIRIRVWGLVSHNDNKDRKGMIVLITPSPYTNTPRASLYIAAR